MPPRKLTRESVVAQAVGVADRSGIEALTMRALARDLGVEAMSLYHHVANKEQLLDAIVDRVYAEVEPPIVGGDWRAGMRARALSLRAALRRHPWALPLMESRRSPGPATLAYHEATLACLRAAAFPPRLVAHAAAVVDAFVYGFVLQETTLPFDSGEAAAAFVSDEPLGGQLADYPHMAWFAREVVLAPDYSFEREFGPGLDLILDGLAARLAATGPTREPEGLPPGVEDSAG